jgi:quercetin dioxygenase-like cupin family protein
MAIQIVEIEEVKALRPGGASVAPTLLMDTDTMRALLLNLAAGQSVAPCQMPTTVLYYVIEGKGRLRVENEQAELQTGSLVLVPANFVRAISAAEPMRVLAVQVL